MPVISKKLIVAGTGHRPKYCPCKYKENHPWLIRLKEDLETELLKLNPSAVITGMALGWDTWIAQAALNLSIPIRAYIPFKGQGSNWPSESREVYEDILSKAESYKIVSPVYTKECFLDRDRLMIDHSTNVFCLLDPKIKTGGTYYTVQYAKEKRKPVTNFWRD